MNIVNIPDAQQWIIVIQKGLTQQDITSVKHIGGYNQCDHFWTLSTSSKRIIIQWCGIKGNPIISQNDPKDWLAQCNSIWRWFSPNLPLQCVCNSVCRFIRKRGHGSRSKCNGFHSKLWSVHDQSSVLIHYHYLYLHAEGLCVWPLQTYRCTQFDHSSILWTFMNIYDSINRSYRESDIGEESERYEYSSNVYSTCYGVCNVQGLHLLYQHFRPVWISLRMHQ